MWRAIHYRPQLITEQDSNDQQRKSSDTNPWRRFFWLWAALIALLHFILALSYSAVMPYRTPGVSYHTYLHDVGAPDEAAHAEVIGHIIKNNEYPVLDPKSPNIKTDYEAHQPPLFYTLEAFILKALGQTNLDAPSFGRVGRTLNAFFGSMNVFSIAAFLWWLLAFSTLHRARIALAGATLAAIIPMNISVSGSINNDSLCFALLTGSWALVTLARVQNSAEHEHKGVGLPLVTILLAGALLGLAVLTKFIALIGIPVFIVLAWILPGKGRLCIFRTGAGTLVALAIFTPWVLRNVSVYNEPFVTQTFSQAFTPNPKYKFSSKGNNNLRIYRFARHMVETTQETATGVFGYFDIHYPPQIPAIATWALIFLSAIGIAHGSINSHNKELVVAGFAFALFAGAYIAFNLRYDQPQARYVFPALPFIVLFPALGLSRLNPRFTAAYFGAYLILTVYTLPMLRFQYWLRTNPDEYAYTVIPPSQVHRFPPPRPLTKSTPDP